MAYVFGGKFRFLQQSTGFAGPEGDLPVLPARQQAVADAAMEDYQRLHALRLTPG